MTIFDSFLLAQLDVFIPALSIAFMLLVGFELIVSVRLLLRRPLVMTPVAIRRDTENSASPSRSRIGYD